MDGETTIELIDRYSALGIRCPHPLTVCGGPCEGVGVYPVYAGSPRHAGMQPVDPLTAEEAAAVARIEAESGVEDDGWYFIPCPRCHRTGRCGRLESVRRIPRWIWKAVGFLWSTRKAGYLGGEHTLPLRVRFRIALGIAS